MDYAILQSFTYIIGILYIVIRMGKECNLRKRLLFAVIIAISISVFARLCWALENIKYFMTGVYDITNIINPFKGGLKIIGVLIGAVIGVLILRKLFKEHAQAITNASIEAMFLTAGYTKLVCTIKGECCLGKPTNLPWAISYPNHNIYNLHPTACYELITWWGCFLLLHILRNKVKPDSSRMCFVVALYVAIRLCVLEGLYAGAQFFGNLKFRIIYLSIIIICLVVIFINDYKNRKNKVENK